MKKMKTIKTFLICLIAIISLSVMSVSAQQSLTLEDCRKMALEQNKKVNLAKEDVQIADYKKKVAATNYLPKISFSGIYLHSANKLKLYDNDLFLPVVPYNTINPQTGAFNPNALMNPITALKTFVFDPRTGQPMVDAQGNPVFRRYAYIPAEKLEFGNLDNYLMRFSLKQPIFTGFKIVEANNIAEHMQNIARENLTLTKVEVLTKTDEAYWRAVSLQEKVKLAYSYQTLLDKLVTDLENIYAEGMITRNDLLKAQVKQNEAKLKVLKAENGFELSKMALAQIIGTNSSDIILPENVIEEDLLPNNFYVDTKATADNRAEISMLKEKLSIMESSINIERSNFMPNILLTGGYNWINPNPFNGFKNEFGGNFSVGLVVSMPIFTWGERVYKMNIANTDTTNNEKKAIVVSVKEAVEMEYTPQLNYTGTAEPNKEVNLGSAIPGRIEKINYSKGSYVPKNAVIAQMSDEMLIQAEIELAAIRKDFERIERLKEKGSVSIMDYDHIKAKLDATQTKVNMLKKNTLITAPFDGVLVDIMVHEGENYSFVPSVNSELKLKNGIVTLMQLNPLKVKVEVNERELRNISKGQSVRVVFDSYPDEPVLGEVVDISPIISTISRTTTVEVSIPNTQNKFKPGMFCRTSIEMPKTTGVFVPINAIQRRQGTGEDIVYVVNNDNTVSRIQVTRGEMQNQLIRIPELENGTIVVIDGKSKLEDGDKIEIVK